MKLLLVLLSTLLASQAFSESCIIVPKDNMKIEWKAYKTPAKVGVKGVFDHFTISKELKGKTLKDTLTGSEFEIDTKSVNTNDKGRDKTIVTHFFNNGDLKIKGKIKEVVDRKISVEMTINNVTKVIPLKLEKDDGKYEAEGYIDILDFSGSSFLDALNKACGTLHEGKTWSDVEIELTFRTRNC